MTYATDTYTGDGSQTEFTVTFKYIQRDHVTVKRRVTADKTDTTLTVITSGTPTGDQYIWKSDTEILVGTAPTAAQQCIIERDTPEDQQLVQWKDGSYIVAEDLNTSDKQWLYGLQELEDRVSHMTGTVFPGVEGLITQSQAEKDPNDPAWSGDEKLGTVGATERIYSNLVGKGSNYPGPGNKGKHGKLRIDHDSSVPDLFFWNEDASPPAWQQVATQGKAGTPGPKGDPPGLQTPPTVVSNVPPKSDNTPGAATVAIDQDSSGDLKFTFGIPEGAKGDKGDAGAGGAAATVEVDSTVTGNPGTSAKVENTGTTSAAKFKFTIPRGDTGPAGPAPGLQSTPATAVNVANKNTTTLGDATAKVTKDSSDNLLFEFGIPVGLKGDKGDAGTGVTYKGLADFTDSSAEPSVKINGDYYMNNKAGLGVWTGMANAAVDEADRAVWNGTTNKWDLLAKPGAPQVDLGYDAKADSGVVTNTGGADATIPQVTGTNAGLMNPTQSNKLDNIEAEAQKNWAEPADDGNQYARVRVAGSPSGGWERINVGTITAVTGGSGIEVTGGNAREVAIDYGQGVEDDGSDQLTIKLDGTTLTKSDNGLRVSATYQAPTANSANFLSTTRTLWGQNFNGTANVSGALTDVGNITGSGAIEVLSSSNGDITLTPHGTGTIIGNSGASFGDEVIVRGGNGLQLNSTDNTRSVRHIALGALATNAIYTWPAAPAANRILQSAATGVLSWIDAGTIGGFWQKTGSTLSPATANESVNVAGTGTLNVGGESTFNAHVNIRSASELRLFNTANTFSVRHEAAGGLGSNATYTWPALPAGNRILQTNDSGTLEWVEGAGNGTTEGGEVGGVKDLVFQENEMVVRTSYSLTANRSALSAGPITINDTDTASNAVVVTIPNGASWVIL